MDRDSQQLLVGTFMYLAALFGIIVSLAVTFAQS